MKKWLSLLMFFLFFPVANASIVLPENPSGSLNDGFADAHGISAREAIDFLRKNNIVNGFDDGTFRPDNKITRAEFLKILLFSQQKTGKGCVPTKTFPDVQKEAWYFDVLCQSVNDGVVHGYSDGTMRPNDPISFSEAAKITAKIYELKVETTKGEEWFTPFVRSLERERVFPESVNDIHQKLRRGEMAQMAWGVMTGKEVENKNRGDLPRLNSCDELSAQMEKFRRRQNTSSLRGGYVNGEVKLMMAEDVAVSAPALSISKAESATDFSTTNIQEVGVDEADIIKNDGSHIFIAKGDKVRIIRAFPVKDMREDSTISFEDGLFPKEMFVDGNTLTVIAQSGRGGDIAFAKARGEIDSAIPSYHQPTSVAVFSFDISDRKNPKKIRSVHFEGNYISSRKRGDTVYLVSNRYNNVYNIPRIDNDIMPLFQDDAFPENRVANCADIRYIPNFSDASFVTVAAINTKNPAIKVDREVILGAGNQIYASKNNIFLTQQKWDEIFWEKGSDSGWRNAEKTDIYKFALRENMVDFVAKGSVLGRVLNSYSMSEFDGFFRIATQVGRAWGKSLSESRISILDNNLNLVSQVDGIAPGENLKSARFTGSRGFLVTFKTVDPLFVVDLDPKNPRILGKLKIPGWSDYLHPYDENYLIGFGKEVDESIDADKVHSDNAVYYTAVLGMKVSLFDISDLKNPIEKYKIVIGDRGTTSALLQNPKALLFDKAKGILGFPITITKNKNGKVGTDAQIETIFSGAIVLNIDPQTGFSERGRASNYKDNAFFLKSGEYFYGDQDHNIQRIIYIGDHFYTIAQNFVEALSWSDLNLKKTFEIDPTPCAALLSEGQCANDNRCTSILKNIGECTRLENGALSCGDKSQFVRCEEK